MHYDDSGPPSDPKTGLPLLLLHAYPVDSRMWDGVRAALGPHARVITPDQRGFGRSPLPAEPDGTPPRLDTVVADVLALLDDLGAERAVLGGCSMGGYVALTALSAAPHRVAGLILADTRAEADTAEQRANRDAQAERAGREGIGWLADAMLPALLGATTHAHRPELVERARALIGEQSPSAVRWALRAMAARSDTAAALSAASVPTLVLVGNEDTITPPEFADRLAGWANASTLVRLAGCGHLAALEDPAAAADAISGWLPTLAE